MTPPSTPSQDFKPEHEGKSKLPLVIAGILLILAMAGAYFLYMLYQTPTTTEVSPAVETQAQPTSAPTPTMTEEEKAQQDVDALEKVSESDEVESLQQDVENTNLSTLDSSLTPAAQ
jgi:flagellar biosynthesis/type III secretory pathway M-ring protein FliF/YscJ